MNECQKCGEMVDHGERQCPDCRYYEARVPRVHGAQVKRAAHQPRVSQHRVQAAAIWAAKAVL